MRGFLAASRVCAALVLSVELLLELAASGAAQADILARYPQLTAEGLAAAFRYAAQALNGNPMWELRVVD
jgi:uncharacterized protein (DUF433 family)